MRRKIVLIIEDAPGVRATYARDLENRGFKTFSAGTVKGARQEINKLGGKVNVALLDMRLEDKDEPNTTGADLGLELKKKCADVTPEFLIRSGYADFVFLESAFELGAAAYLDRN